MHRFFPTHHCFQSEHCQNRQRHHANFLIADSCPGKRSQDHIRDQRNGQTIHSNPFTRMSGAQGRIRTSVPRKEEQIYSLPALTTHPPVQKRRQPALLLCAQSRADRGRYEKIEELNARGNPLARKHLTWKNFLMECRWKICYAAALPCVSEYFLELAKGFEPLTL